MDDTQKNRLRGYAWKYFEFHAEQRLKTFYLYLILVAANIGAFSAALNAALNVVDNIRWLSIYGFLLFFLSVVFGKLDHRNKELVRNGEEALKHLDELEELSDSEDEPNILKIFAHDDFILKRKKADSVLRIPITYSIFLKIVFRVLGSLGLAVSIACLIS